MTSHPEAILREAETVPQVRSVPLSHQSIEVGHLYFEDFLAGPQHMRALFAQVKPWVAAAREICADGLDGRTPRISTCFLIDDYFGPSIAPGSVIPGLLTAAEAAGVQIDYLAREAGCARADDAPLANLVEERIVADPPPDTTGSRPPVTETGWLCNGQRSPVTHSAAMEMVVPWAPPAQNAANRHSVFVDVELWSAGAHGRIWSCAFLAAVWQLLRLGLLRNQGNAVATPQSWHGPWPDRWDGLPAVIKVNPKAAHFTAYQAMSVLPKRFITTEHAVRTILDQVSLDRHVAEDVLVRSRREGLQLPPEPTARIDYVFIG